MNCIGCHTTTLPVGPDRMGDDLRPIFVRAEHIDDLHARLEPKKPSTSAGLRPSSSFTLSGVRASTFATAAATSAGSAYAPEGTSNLRSPSDSASILDFRISFPLLVATARLPSLEASNNS